jgi:hypothetical protein
MFFGKWMVFLVMGVSGVLTLWASRIRGTHPTVVNLFSGVSIFLATAGLLLWLYDPTLSVANALLLGAALFLYVGAAIPQWRCGQ